MPETILKPPPGFDNFPIERRSIISSLCGIGLLRPLNAFPYQSGINVSFANASRHNTRIPPLVGPGKKSIRDI
jgi:hypothetical protein